MQLPQQLTSYQSPDASWSSSRRETYDYSGLDDHINRQDLIGQLRDSKFQSYYTGDVAGGVSKGNQIRDLLSAVKANAPAATERNPVQVVSPLVRVTSTDTSHSGSIGSEKFSGKSDGYALPQPEWIGSLDPSSPKTKKPPKQG